MSSEYFINLVRFVVNGIDAFGKINRMIYKE